MTHCHTYLNTYLTPRYKRLWIRVFTFLTIHFSTVPSFWHVSDAECVNPDHQLRFMTLFPEELITSGPVNRPVQTRFERWATTLARKTCAMPWILLKVSMRIHYSIIKFFLSLLNVPDSTVPSLPSSMLHSRQKAAHMIYFIYRSAALHILNKWQLLSNNDTSCICPIK